MSGFVYFIMDDYSNMVKIGFSENVDSRMVALQTGNPNELRLLGWVVGTRKLEALLHGMFHLNRSRGEWFKNCSAIREFVAKDKRFVPFNKFKKTHDNDPGYKSSDIMRIYGLSKSKLDNIIRRRRLSWGLTKNQDGYWVWNELSIKRLENYLFRISKNYGEK